MAPLLAGGLATIGTGVIYAGGQARQIARGFWWRVHRGTVARLFLATTLPNVPLLLVRGALHMKFAFINLDYFFLTLLACEGSPALAQFLFALTYLLELVRVVDSVFYFSQRDPLFAIRFLSHVHKALILGWAAVFLLVLGASLWLWRAVLQRLRGRPVWQSAVPVAVLLLLLLSVDQALGYKLLGTSRHLRWGNRAVDETLLRMPLTVARPAPPPAIVAADKSASGPLWSTGQIAKKHENVVLVVVESMGRLRDSGGFTREFAPFSDPRLLQRYTVRMGTVPFTGATIAGEMRELCRLRTGLEITGNTLKNRQPCLPERYRRAGYDAVAFHGFRGTMFQRSEWYPLLGFTATHFLDDMTDQRQCDGAFYGVCDEAIVSMMDRRLQAQRQGTAPPQFLYWMTLNSHLAVDEQSAPAEVCPVAANRHVCAHLAYVQKVLDSVKQLALDPAIGPTHIMLVGDHAPPFITPDDRNRFNSSVVPFIYLQPR